MQLRVLCEVTGDLIRVEVNRSPKLGSHGDVFLLLHRRIIVLYQTRPFRKFVNDDV